MAKGNFRTDETTCLYCGHIETKDGKRVKMPHKIGKGANKVYLCENCYNKEGEKQCNL